MWYQTEEILSLAQAGKRYPSPVHPSTVFRHVTKPNRFGIRLESFLQGGRRYTTAESLDRYFERTTEAANGAGSTPPSTISSRTAVAEAELDSLLGGAR